ncbi:MAG: serine hydrolase domain-containing protein [Chitinophagaceae bacterium]
MKKLIILLVGISIYNCAASQTYISLFAQNQKNIDSLLKSIYNDSLPGISIGIVFNGKSVFEKSYGITNIINKQKITASSNFNICSLTKQFTALAILQLEKKHLLSLTDKLSGFFPDMNKKVAEKITIQELLTHSSGIVDHYDYTNTSQMKHAHNADVYNAIKNIDTTYFEPGSRFKYSNTGYCLLALVIEKITGMKYNDYMLKNVFAPAGMKNTIIWNETAIIRNEVTGYTFDSVSAMFKQSGANEHIFFSTEGDGGVYTSVRDYEHWFAALENGKVFSKTIVDKARTIEYKIDAAKKIGYGYGWFIDENDALTKVYHSGDNGGFKTYSFTIPQLNFMVVIFSNRDDINLENIVQQIVNLLLPANIKFTPVEVMTS